uniref:Protein SPA1-RELATED 3 n=1 Tax=Anthurium amnicola TaxID=1678845 RepID=A0A1D1Z4E4_9ARAE
MGGMDGSEEESRWERWSGSRGLNTPPHVVSSGSLGLPLANPFGSSSTDASARKPRGAPVPQEVDRGGLLSCSDHFDGRRGSLAHLRSSTSNDDHHHHHHHRHQHQHRVGSCAGVEGGEVSLREWLDRPERPVDLLECLHIFRQVVEMVSLAHSQGVVVNNVRPSCFVMSTFNRVSFIESASCSSSGSGSDSCGDPGGLGRRDPTDPCSASPSRPTGTAPEGAFEQASETICMRSFSVRSEEEGSGRPEVREVADKKKSFPLKQVLLMEYDWYTSPEEGVGGSSSFASDIYRLGVLLFELFCPFNCLDEKLVTMSNLRHRVLPPPLLLKWSKEAVFCLWLLHPHPSNRPQLSEVLQSEFLNEPRESLAEREAAIKLREEIEDQELLLEFLLQLQQHKQETADKLHEAICCLSSDVEEVLKQLAILKKKGSCYSEFENEEYSAVEKVDQALFYSERVEDSVNSGSRKRIRPRLQDYREDEPSEPLSEGPRSETQQKNQEIILSKSSRLMKNFKKLETAYFSTRFRIINPAGRLVNRNLAIGSLGRGSVVRTEGSSVDNLPYKEIQSEGRQSEWINPFLEGLCKYLSFSKLRVRADLKQGDLLNSSNLVCSLGFDRDKELFATAGVNRKIKIFECDMLLNEDRDIHYPVVEMASRSKLSSVCWNSYIKSQIASSDFEGVVQVWDVTRSQVFLEMREHERRVWSVDFSLADPTKLASGSDDGTVKLWNINQAIPLLHLVLGALGLSKQRLMFALFSSLRTLVGHLQLVQQIIGFTYMIFVT